MLHEVLHEICICSFLLTYMSYVFIFIYIYIYIFVACTPMYIHSIIPYRHIYIYIFMYMIYDVICLFFYFDRKPFPNPRSEWSVTVDVCLF